MEAKEKFSSIAYYLIIGLVSLIMATFIPMIGTTAELGWTVPATLPGWIVWSISKISIAVGNMLIFHCFMQQGKVNVKDNEKFIEAENILEETRIKRKILPEAPNKWLNKQYLSKGSSIFICSLLSVIGFAQAMLTFDVLSLISIIFTIIMGLIFGYISMRKAERYWTTEYYEYAIMQQNQLQEEKENGRCQVQESSTTSSEKSM